MFHSARLKLTFWYLLIIMCVSLTFSTVIYQVLTHEIDRFERAQRYRIEGRLRTFSYLPVLVGPELVAETKQRIFMMLLMVNGAVLVLSGGLGYLLAGRTLKPIKQMLDEQNRFVSDASHELRTPLTSLKTAFEVYLRGRRPSLSEAKVLVTESIVEVDKLQSLSESLLRLAQSQEVQNFSQYKVLHISQVVKQAVKRITPLAHERNIMIINNVGNLLITGDRTSLEDLVVILLDNAIKYSKPGSEVRILGKLHDGAVSLVVVDNGIGIDPLDQPYIFDRFYRADKARNGSRGGYGLGLAIARSIVNAHGGQISFKSEPGVETVFSVRLPIEQRTV